LPAPPLEKQPGILPIQFGAKEGSLHVGLQLLQVRLPLIQIQPLDEELLEEEEELLDEGHSTIPGSHKSGASLTQHVREPLVHDIDRPTRLQEGVPPFGHRQPEEDVDMLPEEELLDEEEVVDGTQVPEIILNGSAL